MKHLSYKIVLPLGSFILLLSFVLATNPVSASQRGDVYRHAKSGTALIIGVDGAGHSLSIGSGFFISQDGILLTNAHIVEDNSRLVIYVGNEAIFPNPDVLLVDRDADLAVLRIQLSQQVDALTLATDLPDEGTPVIAVGYPRLTDVLNIGFALHSTIAQATINGIAHGRTRVEGRSTTFLQTTGMLNSGNSGGPLIDVDSGEVVGMVTQTVPYLEQARDRNGNAIGGVMIRSGIGYAIPATGIRQWLIENRLDAPARLNRPSSALTVNIKKDDPATDANRSFATGHVLHMLALVLSLDSDLLGLAVSHYEAALEHHSGAPWILCNLGMAYLALGKKDEAMAKFDAALKSDPTSTTAAYHLGLALEAKGQQNDALIAWQNFLTNITPSAIQDEWSTKMREAVTQASGITASLHPEILLTSSPTETKR